MEDYVAQAMALAAMAKAKGGTTDAYTKAQTDALLDGKADLVDGKIPASELPSYVDDVLEYASTAAFPATGESGKIYVATDTNKTYRWGGSAYVEISESLALGETASTAYPGNKGKANADAIAAIKDGTNIDSFADVEAEIGDLAEVAKSGSYNDLTDKPTIPTPVTVDQTFDGTSANAQSGVAVQEAISSDKYLLSNIYSLTGIVISSLAELNQTGRYVTNCYYSVSKTNSESLPAGHYIGYTLNGLVSIYVFTSSLSSTMHIRGFLTDYTSLQYTAGTTFNTNISDIRLIKVG